MFVDQCADLDAGAPGRLRRLGCAGLVLCRRRAYFERAESTLGITGLRDPNPTTAGFLEACETSGIDQATDITRPEGYEPIRVNQRNGRRWSAADGYLKPALQRENLSVLTGVTVRRVVLEGTRAIGVEIEDGDGLRFVGASREVLLSAGAIGSPHLLMLSGIGDADDLGRQTRVNLPGVGRNLQDHLFVPLALQATEPVSPGVGDQAEDVLAFFRHRTGKLTSNLAEAVAWVRTADGLPAPDVELLWMPVPYLDHGRGAELGHGVTLSVVLLQPASSGRITLKAGEPVIEPGYLTDPQDLSTLRAGIDQAREVLYQPSLKRWLGDPLVPAVLEGTEAATDGLIRQYADTLYHPVGTCRIGDVLDADLRVRGTEGLRVIDASALPVIPRAHTHAPTVMLAERAAELVRSFERNPS